MILAIAIPFALLVSPEGTGTALGIGFAVLLALMLPLGLLGHVRQFLRDEETILASRRAESSGDEATAERLLEPLATHASPALRARVRHVRAVVACAKHRYRDALSECDAGLAELAVAAQARGVTREGVHPELLAERAYVLAVLGRRAEAEQELATLEGHFNAWNDRTTKILRVRLALAVIARDMKAAIALARSRTPNMRLPPVDDAVADLILAASGALDAPSMRRLEQRITRDETLANGIEDVAPGLFTAIFGEAEPPRARVDARPPMRIEDTPESAPEEVDELRKRAMRSR